MPPVGFLILGPCVRIASGAFLSNQISRGRSETAFPFFSRTAKTARKLPARYAHVAPQKARTGGGGRFIDSPQDYISWSKNIHNISTTCRSMSPRCLQAGSVADCSQRRQRLRVNSYGREETQQGPPGNLNNVQNPWRSFWSRKALRHRTNGFCRFSVAIR